MGRRRVILLALVVAGGLATATGSASAAGWLAPQAAPPADWSVDAQDVALDEEGNAVAVWTANGSGLDGRVTQVATRPVGGSWSPVVTLSPDGEDGGWDPEVAVGPNGDAVVVWSSVRYGGPWTRAIVLAASLEAGGGWSEPVALSDEEGIAVSYQPEVVVDGQGNATAIWSEETGDASVVRTRTRPRDGEWGERVDLTDSAVGWEPQLAIDPQGNLTAVWNWRHIPEYGGGIIQSKSRPAGGTWSAEPVDLSDGDERALEPQVAVDPHGNAVVVWYSDTVDDPRVRAVRAARRVADSGWGAAVDLARGHSGDLLPHVAIDSQGTATAVWESYDSVGLVVRSSTSAADGPWSDAVDISVRDDGPWAGSFPQVTVDLQGNVTAVWRAWYEDRFSIVQAARREAGDGWGAPVDLGSSSGVIEAQPVVVDPQGYVTAVWTRGRSLRSAVFDPVAPELRDLAVPVTGVVGQPVAMSVSPFDVWSSVATSWDFGDGGSGPGATVEHCYGSPGEHTVTVTGADLAANVTSASRTISIEPDPAADPGSDPCAGPGPPDPPDDPGPPGDPGPRDPGGRLGPEPGPGPAIAPALSGLRQSSSRWRTQGARGRSRLPVGATFRFKLDRPAQVRLAVSQVVSGRRAGGRCVKATKANRNKPRCDRYRSRGALEVAGKAGANAHSFRGRIRGRTLAPGRYRLVVTALADGKRSAPAAVRFTIAR